MGAPEYLRLKNHIVTKNLKNGEFLLLDTETGIWVKTSLSFKRLYEIIKKGTSLELVKEVMANLYPRRENEVEICLESLKTNGFLEGFETNLLTPLNKTEPIRIICDSLVNKKFLIEFLSKIFGNIPIELILEFNFYKGKKINIDFSQLYLPNIELIVRIDWDMVCREFLQELNNYNILTLQINFKDLGEHDKINEKKELIEEFAKEKKVELRYEIAVFAKKMKKAEDLFLPFILMPHASYYFIGEEIFNLKEGKDRYKYFVAWIGIMSKFYQLFSLGAKSLTKFSSGNFLPMIVFSRILKDSCGAGTINFYIDMNGNIYPCKYLKDFLIGNINELFFSPFNTDNYKKYSICERCELLRVCSRLCLGLHREEFSKICKFYKELLIKYITAVPINPIKRFLQNADESKISEFKTSSIAKEERNKFTRRCICPIGTF